jgi:hypothetical protein
MFSREGVRDKQMGKNLSGRRKDIRVDKLFKERIPFKF